MLAPNNVVEEPSVPVTVLYPEAMYPDNTEEQAIFGPDVTILQRSVKTLSELSDADCATVDGLMIFRHWMSAADVARFPRLRAVVRMGVGYDRLDRAAAAARGITVCNVPDYGTKEIADHAFALALSLRRGLFMHHERQRGEHPAPWLPIVEPKLMRRSSVQGFGIVGFGRIVIAVALRAKACGFRVWFYDPYKPNGYDLALGVERCQTLHELMSKADVLSLHALETPETIGMIDRAALAALPDGAVVINTARGPLIDIEALTEGLRSGRIAAAGLDVVPIEPPDSGPLPELLRAYRAREPWLEGRLVVTPHCAYWTPEAYADIRTKSAETMREALGNRPQNVIPPESY